MDIENTTDDCTILVILPTTAEPHQRGFFPKGGGSEVPLANGKRLGVKKSDLPLDLSESSAFSFSIETIEGTTDVNVWCYGYLEEEGASRGIRFGSQSMLLLDFVEGTEVRVYEPRPPARK